MRSVTGRLWQENYDNRKKAVRELKQNWENATTKESWEKAMIKERELRESYDKRKKAVRKLWWVVAGGLWQKNYDKKKKAKREL